MAALRPRPRPRRIFPGAFCRRPNSSLSSESASDSLARPSETSNRCTARAKARWSSSEAPSLSSSLRALRFYVRTPQFDDALGASRALEAGQALANHHRHRLLERRLVAVARLGEGGAMILVVEHGGDVGGDALHAPRPNRFDARLLDRIEECSRGRILRLVALVDRLIVAGEPQRHRVGEPAQNCRLAQVGFSGRLGKPRASAFGAGNQRGLIGGEADFEVRAPRHGASRAAERALKRLRPALRFLARLAVGGFYVDGGHAGSELTAGFSL